MEISAVFKAMGEDIRLRMMGLLLKSELCVCDIEEVLGISQANASRHLLKLKSAGILSSRKNAQWVYYSIDKKLREAHPELVTALESEVKKLANYKNDTKALAAIQKKKQGAAC